VGYQVSLKFFELADVVTLVLNGATDVVADDGNLFLLAPPASRLTKRYRKSLAHDQQIALLV
jgi:hypothetical protein